MFQFLYELFVADVRSQVRWQIAAGSHPANLVSQHWQKSAFVHSCLLENIKKLLSHYISTTSRQKINNTIPIISKVLGNQQVLIKIYTWHLKTKKSLCSCASITQMSLPEMPKRAQVMQTQSNWQCVLHPRTSNDLSHRRALVHR